MLMAPRVVWACNSEVFPPCGQTIYLAKFVQSTIVNPGPNAPITVSVGLLPFVSWKLVQGCAQPSAQASVSITMTCTPAGGGTPVNVGMQTQTLPMPTVPGIQSVAPFTYTIPAGTLPQGNFVCSVQGAYNVTFNNGTGAGTITGVGDTTVCIVEPAPGDPTRLRLSLERLNLGDAGFQMCRRGDQTWNYYLAINNDPVESVTLNLESSTNQVAIRPTSNTDGSTLFAISSVEPGTDNFPQALPEDLGPNGLIPQPDPLDAVVDGRVNTTLTLPPNGLKIIPIAIRSNGMCANGSCSEVTAQVSGTFSKGGSIVIASAGTATIVQDTDPKSPSRNISTR
jgi:hypothetical protein